VEYTLTPCPVFWDQLTIVLPDGRRFRGSTGVKEKSMASEIEAKVRTDLVKGSHYGTRNEMTLYDAADKYWKSHAEELTSANTIAYIMEYLVAGLGADTLLHEITNAKIAEFVTEHKSKVSSASVNRYLAHLRAIMRMARDRFGAFVPVMPIWKAHFQKESAPRDRTLSHEEANKLIDAAPDHLKPIIKFALMTGARKSNILNLRWEDVDLFGRQITFKVKSSKVAGGKNHVLPINDELLDLLKSLHPKPEGYVFLYAGRKIDSVRTGFDNAMEKAGIKNFCFHGLRHTAGTWMVRSGASIDITKKVLGHASISTTMRYAHRNTDEIKDAMARGLSISKTDANWGESVSRGVTVGKNDQ
jgi:integrase